jgi:hypothetical protein
MIMGAVRETVEFENRFQDYFLFTFRVQYTYFNYVTPNDIIVTTFVVPYSKMSFDVVGHDSNSPTCSLIIITMSHTAF